MDWVMNLLRSCHMGQVVEHIRPHEAGGRGAAIRGFLTDSFLPHAKQHLGRVPLSDGVRSCPV